MSGHPGTKIVILPSDLRLPRFSVTQAPYLIVIKDRLFGAYLQMARSRTLLQP